MISYFFYIFRYMPCVERGEFVNIGIILFQEKRNYILFSRDIDRLMLLDPKVDLNSLHSFFEEFRRSSDFKSALLSLPENIVLSPKVDGVSDAPAQNIFYELYDRLVKN